MIHIFISENISLAKEKSNKFLDILKKKRPAAEIFFFDQYSLPPEFPDSFLGQLGLFDQKNIVILNQVLENAVIVKNIISNIEQLSTSDNAFLLIEKNIDTKTKKVFSEYEVKIDEFKQSTKEEKLVTSFAIVDAFFSGKSTRAWELFRKSLDNGASPEEIFGVFWWQMKSLFLVHFKEDKKAGMKPFVVSKAKKIAQDVGFEKMMALSDSLLGLYQRSRQGKQTLAESLEQWILRGIK